MQLLLKLLRSHLVQLKLQHLHVRTSQCTSTEFLERRKFVPEGSPETSMFQGVLESCTGTLLSRYTHAR